MIGVMFSGMTRSWLSCQPAPSRTSAACAPGADGFGDFLEMLVHGFGVGVGHHKPRAHPTVRADGAEQIGPLVARIAHGAGPGSFSRPKPCQRSLLSDPRLVLKPDFDGLGLGVFRKAIA